MAQDGIPGGHEPPLVLPMVGGNSSLPLEFSAFFGPRVYCGTLFSDGSPQIPSHLTSPISCSLRITLSFCISRVVS